MVKLEIEINKTPNIKRKCSRIFISIFKVVDIINSCDAITSYLFAIVNERQLVIASYELIVDTEFDTVVEFSLLLTELMVNT